MTAATWPEGVIARYLTVGGATVDLTEQSILRSSAGCEGCGTSHPTANHLDVKKWAQAHAERCRAMPRPDGAR